MKIHLDRYCSEVNRSRLDEIYKDTTALIDEIDNLCSDGESAFLQSWLKTRKIPSLRLSIKDHQPPQTNGRYKTRLIVSAHNFTQCLSKLASKSIESTFRRAAINFERYTLKNSLALKRNFEVKDFHRDDVTIVSLDIKDMYPQCRFGAVQAAVKHYYRQLEPLAREKIRRCLDILKFSMGNTIVSFRDRYYEYGVDNDPNRRGLTIGGFESAFLADLECSFIFEKLQHLFVHHTYFVGTYRDDEIIVFRGQRSNEWLHSWLQTFQHEVDRLLGTLDIQFTMEIWRPGNVSQPLPDSEVTVEGIGTFHRVNIYGETSFPYLDVKISWNDEGKLNFNVYKKPRELVKYLNHDSHHHRHHKSAVLSGVELRLALLTTMTPTNADLSISDIYPDKHEALSTAGQLKPNQKMRTLRAVLEDNTQSGPTRREKRNRTIDHRNTIFIVKYADLGKEPLIKRIRRIRNELKLKWLRPHVIYSRHTNLREKLLGDLNRKLLHGIVDADYGTRPCNCPTRFKINGNCAYSNGETTCRTAGIVYKISCKNESCKCFYIGKSQRYVKTRVQEHIGEVTKLYDKHILSSNQPNQPLRSPPPTQTTDNQSASLISLMTQEKSPAQPSEPNEPPPLCVIIEDHVPTIIPRTMTMRLRSRANSDLTESISSISANDDSTEKVTTPDIPLDEPPPPTQAPPIIIDPKKENCSALARHLFSHVKNLIFKTKAEVADWCRSHLEIKVIWRSNTISLLKSAASKKCRLCATERMFIGRHFGSENIINLKSELRGVCNCKTRFLRFARSS
jgi:hypothetical protein